MSQQPKSNLTTVAAAPAATPSTTVSSNGDTSMQTNIIVGVTIGVIGLIVLASCIVVCVRIRRRGSNTSNAGVAARRPRRSNPYITDSQGMVQMQPVNSVVPEAPPPSFQESPRYESDFVTEQAQTHSYPVAPEVIISPPSDQQDGSYYGGDGESDSQSSISADSSPPTPPSPRTSPSSSPPSTPLPPSVDHSEPPDPIPSHRMTIEELTYLVSNEEELGQISAEFQTIPNGKGPTMEAKKEENQRKNRSKNFVPFDSTRVVLMKNSAEPGSDYINASHLVLTRNYIAAQGPMDETRYDFWRMIVEKNVHIIVSLSKFEKNECSSYWPIGNDDNHEDGKKQKYGLVTVKTEKHEKFQEFELFSLSYDDDESDQQGEVILLHFTGEWHENGVPQFYSLLRFHRKFCGLTRSNDVIVVQSGAGVGRAGTFIALDALIDEGRKTNTIDVLQCVSQLRKFRSGMIQTEDQYLFLHRCVLQELVAGEHETE